MNDRGLLYLVIGTLVLGGGAVIALVYGPGALLTAIPILLIGALLIFIPFLLLSALQKWRDNLENKARTEAGLNQSPPPEEDG